MRIALFAAPFDPPHRGHLAIAAAAADAFHLDSVLFTPVGRQPLKRDGASASYSDRLALLSLACIPDTSFAVSNLDPPHPRHTRRARPPPRLPAGGRPPPPHPPPRPEFPPPPRTRRMDRRQPPR